MFESVVVALRRARGLRLIATGPELSTPDEGALPSELLFGEPGGAELAFSRWFRTE